MQHCCICQKTIITLLHYYNFKRYIDMKKSTLFLILPFAFFLNISCEKEKMSKVDIQINSPSNNATVGTQVNLNITFSSQEELHDIEISLKKASDHENVPTFPRSIHQHVNSYTFTESVNLDSYPTGTEFHLEATACKNHDCTEKEIKSIHFIK